LTPEPPHRSGARALSLNVTIRTTRGFFFLLVSFKSDRKSHKITHTPDHHVNTRQTQDDAATAAAAAYGATDGDQVAGRSSRLYRPPASAAPSSAKHAPPPEGGNHAAHYDRMMMSGTSLEEPEGYWPNAQGAKYGAYQTEVHQTLNPES
jgi:hypothetical protein